MSIDDARTSRENILRLVRKSASTNYNSESYHGSDDYPEHRKKFLECWKQFEQPTPQIYRKSAFFPYWINPESETDLSISYKKKETRKISNEPDTGKERESIWNGASQSHSRSIDNEHYSTNREKKVDSAADIVAALDSLLRGNSSEILDGRGTRLMNRDDASLELITQSPLFLHGLVEGRSPSTSSKTVASLKHNRMIDTPNENKYTKPILSPKPVVWKLIELKKYDHILEDAIN